MQPEFIYNRTYKAPIQKVFDAYTKQEHLCNWWGSTPFDLVICELDFQVNGRFFYGLVSSDFEMHGVFDYLEIEAPTSISFLNYFAEKNGFPIRHPKSDSWPIKMLNTNTFKKIDDEQTELHIEVSPYEANEDEQKTFEAGIPSLSAGFKNTFDKLEEYLKTMEDKEEEKRE